MKGFAPSILLLACSCMLVNDSRASGPLNLTSFTNYTQAIAGSTVAIEMVAVTGGKISLPLPTRDPHNLTNDQPFVTIQAKPFWMSKYEVRWEEFMLYLWSFPTLSEEADGITRPSEVYGSLYREEEGKSYPARGLSLQSAEMYCRWLSHKTGLHYRLPTETEWEYACRAGATTDFFWGNDPGPAGDFAWFARNSDGVPHPSGSKRPNLFGLHDMAGNVAEWCYKETNPAAGVVRGGSFQDPVSALRIFANRMEAKELDKPTATAGSSKWFLPSAGFVGFRIVRSNSP